MSNAGQEAEGFPREYGNYNFQQYKDWLGQSRGGYQPRGDKLTNWAQDYWLGRADQGFGSPQQIRETGQQIMPGVQQVMDNRRARTGGIGQDFGQTYDAMQGNIDQYGQAIGSNYDQTQGDVNSTFGRMGNRGTAINRDVVNNIADTYGSARQNTGNAYTDLRKDSYGTFDNLNEGADAAFSGAQNTVDMGRPGGDFQAAQAARSFSPMRAATMRRLRASGVDPNSGEAADALSRVDTAQARAMDDAFGNSMDKYIDRTTGLQLGKYNTQADLAKDRLFNNQGLVERNSSIDRGLTLDSGAEFRDETRRYGGEQNAIDAGWLGQTNQNRDSNFDRTRDYFNARNDLNLKGWGIRSDIADRGNADDMTGLDLDNMQFDRGANWWTQDQNSRDRAAGTATNMGQQANQDAMRSAQIAGQFGNDASRAYGQAYGLEAPNAGWGAKLISGAARKGLQMIPGMGGWF